MCLVLATVFVALIFSGGGTLTGVLPILVPALLLALMAQRKQAFDVKATAFFFRTSTLIPFCIALTLVPVTSWLVGEKRASHFARSRAVTQSLTDLGVDMLAGDRLTVADATFLKLMIPRVSSAVVGTPAQQDLVDPPPDGPAEIRIRPVRNRLSLNPAGTFRGLLLYCGIWACFWYVAGGSVSSRIALLRLLVIGGTCVALTGIASTHVWPQGKTLLWTIPIPHGRPVGPFVNRNHFALFCGMILPVSLALSTSGLALGKRLSMGTFAVGAVDRLINLVCSGILASGIVISLSRSGILVLLTGTALLVGLTLRSRIVWGAVLLLIVGTLVTGVLHFPLDDFQERLETLRDPLETESAQTRLNLWSDAVRVWLDFPVVGCGMDAFRVVYPTRKTSTSRKGASHAENEYVQILADHGILGGLLAIVAIGGYSLLLIAPARQGRHRQSRRSEEAGEDGLSGLRTIVLASGGATAVHALFDFGLRVPLNALAFACIMACAVPIPATDPSTMRKDNGLPRSRTPRTAGVKRVAIVMCIALLPLLNAYWLAGRNMDNPRALSQTEVPTLGKAIAWSPTYWFPWHELGRQCRQISSSMASEQDPRAMAFNELSLYSTWTAAHLNASDYRVWQTAAQVAYDAGDLDRASAAAERVILLRPYLAARMSAYLIED